MYPRRHPGFADAYQRQTDRIIPVIIIPVIPLTPDRRTRHTSRLRPLLSS